MKVLIFIAAALLPAAQAWSQTRELGGSGAGIRSGGKKFAASRGALVRVR